MTALEADYYDLMTTVLDAEGAASHPLAPMWEEIVDRCRNEPINDLGCGSGGLLYALVADGYGGEYHGYDFARDVLERLVDSLERDGAELTGKPWRLTTYDLRDDPPWKDVPVSGNSNYVLTEVLEHLDDDVDVLRRWVPPGRRVFFSVPNYASESHVRHFPTPAAAFERYAGIFLFRGWRIFDLSPPEGRAVHLFECVRREDEL